MKALGYNPHVTIQIALAGNAADLIKHHDRAAQRGEKLPTILVGCCDVSIPSQSGQEDSGTKHERSKRQEMDDKM